MNLDHRIDLAVKRLSRLGVQTSRKNGISWITPLESKLGKVLPESYRSLVTRYLFPPIELGPVELFSNQGDSSNDDITAAPFCDPIISAWLIERGYFHFGREISGSYDPICLELLHGSYPNRPTAVVRFNHEAILMNVDAVERSVVSPSFLGLLEETD